MSQQENNQSFWERVRRIVINHKKSAVITLIVALFAAIPPICEAVDHIRDVSKLQIELVEVKQEYANTSEIATFNVNNIVKMIESSIEQSLRYWSVGRMKKLSFVQKECLMTQTSRLLYIMPDEVIFKISVSV